ncbi:MAG TPA: protein-glutamate O-methyltransferase CheR [Gemmatimonadaceae bacterium]|nr:protein-glutamate O-methyltransferase CheR [Gemmatimonadaceae bacterium]
MTNSAEETAESDFRALMDKITRDSGFQCSSYKDKCLRRRIAVRMRARATDSYADYADLLDGDVREYQRLVRSLTVNVTKFFRNWETYEAIQRHVIPKLLDRGEEELRIWSAGCSSGEEPYSMAILLHKHATENGRGTRLRSARIIGTDIDNDCLGEAERAFYTEKALGDTPPHLVEQYFPAVAGMRSMLPEVRNLVGFEHRDILSSPPPFESAHLIVCRNVIIYFEREAQERLFEEFHRNLAPGGFLVLGKVETLLGNARGMFTPVNARERVFRKA